MKGSHVQIKMDFRIIQFIILSVSLLYTECAFGLRTTAGCSGIPSTYNRPRTCGVSHTTTQGSSVYLDCKVKSTSDPGRQAVWWKINLGNYSCFGPTLGGLRNAVLHQNFTLELRKVSREDDGIYLCIYLDNTLASHCLSVIAIPTLRVTFNDAAPSGIISATIGQSYVLKCTAYGADPPVNLTWSYNNEMYKKDESKPSVNVVSSASNVRTTSLRLVPIRAGSTNVTCSSNGKYQQQDIMSTLQLKIYAIPSLFIDEHGKNCTPPLRVELKKRYTLTCVATNANPAVNLTWSYNHSLYNVEENDSPFHIINGKTYSTLEFTPIKTGFSNIVCHSTGIYQAQNVNYTLQVEVYAQPVFTNWIVWFGLAAFALTSITIGFLVRYKAGKCNTPQENKIYYQDIRLSSKSSTFETFRKRESGSIPLKEIKQKDCNFGVDTIDKVTREDVSVMTLIPSRSFLKYFKGSYHRSGKSGYVLVKTVKEYAYVKDIYTFAKCSRLMESLPKHENVVTLLGISEEEMPIYSYHEYVECLTLRNYMLQNYQSSGLSASPTFSRNSSDRKENIITIEMYEFAENVASGMCFLISQNFTHPALSLRKVLLSKNGQCKLYDIWPKTMSSKRMSYLLQRKDPPLAWMAPECIFLGQYHLNTDVWSYGVFMWELFSFGETPFKNMSTFEIENEVRNNRNLPMPPNCPGSIFSLMLSSWNKDVEKRPHFDNILKGLSCLLQSIQHENYDQREVDVIQEKNPQYHKYFSLEGQSTDR